MDADKGDIRTCGKVALLEGAFGGGRLKLGELGKEDVPKGKRWGGPGQRCAVIGEDIHRSSVNQLEKNKACASDEESLRGSCNH
ncbi:hypothetical protein BOTBODRAFT_58638 [Botryobasidium botryosum FD-172 SS1]|uniref:Uncharacterized protein n=1 Tax=Botryobasidium botryosum (strain FD-172 SS1) TaxID=930990 RepID=A0A067M3Z6_BOTB1|nr:hypothetical protein BOTBODRAFT_58638 [Botryobasidium botryosum FD-172 SS1]